MQDTIELLGKLCTDIGGTWKQAVLIDNDNDNPYVDAYNEGVNAMASQVIGLLQAILTGKQIQLDQLKYGTILELKKEGEE
jgi:hypothetical protein